MSYVRVWAQDREFDVDVAIQDLRAAAEAAGFLVVDREEADWHCVLWENRQGVSEPCEAGSTHDGDSGCHWRIFPVRC